MVLQMILWQMIWYVNWKVFLDFIFVEQYIYLYCCVSFFMQCLYNVNIDSLFWYDFDY